MPKFTPHRHRSAPAEVRSLAAPRASLRQAMAKQAMPVAVLVALALLLSDRIAELDMAAIRAAVVALPASAWLEAALFTALSFWALGRYDVTIHRLLGLPTDDAQAARAGMSAIAIGQVTGVGMITGTLARWRLLPALSLAEAGKVTALVTASFLLGWGVLAAVALSAVPLPLPGGPWLAALVIGLCLSVALLSVLRPGRLSTLPIPSLKAMGHVLGYAAIDTLSAGMVLYVLLPGSFDVSLAQVLAAYLLALGAGLVLATPGGVGPFELALVTLLPAVPDEALLAAVIAFRLVYYALPFIVAGAYLLLGGGASDGPARPVLHPASPSPSLSLLTEAVIDRAPRAEAALLRHGRLSLMADTAARPAALTARSGQSLIALGDPLRARTRPDLHLDQVALAAKARMLTPVLYKAGAPLAAAARRKGWAVVPIAREAWLDPARFDLAAPAARQLRRKLRKAEKAGVTVTRHDATSHAPLPLSEMTRIAMLWRELRGGERGFSMGTWRPETLPWARVYLARDAEGDLVGFVTVHANAREHTLDLMRMQEDLPDGTMHLLIAAAIEAARDEGVPRFSLAAVPMGEAASDTPLLKTLRAKLDTATGAAGLRQFKTAFDPAWETLYLAAPTRAAIALGALDIMREITRTPAASIPALHDDHASNRFA